jgi:hypothetical protein
MSDAFENKIREKLSEADIPFDAKAWKKMEKKLNALSDDRPTGAIWWWITALLLFLGIGGFMWWNYTSKPATQPTQQEITKTAPPPALKDQTGPVSTAPQEKAAATTPKQEQPGKTGETIPGKAGNDPGRGVNHTAPAANKADSVPAYPSTDIPAQPTATAGKDDLFALQGLRAGNPGVHTNISGTANSNIALRPVSEPAQKPKEKETVPRRKGFAIGLVLGPDFNVAPSFKYTRVGWNAGMLANYHINNRWFLTAGAVYSKKPYAATKNDYKRPIAYLKRADAVCDVLDIPLNVTYNFVDKPKHTLGATAGLSSYFMLKEKYNYIYTGSGYPPGEKLLRNENQHYLSVLNVGLTYQRPLNSRLTLIVQPYAKVPLADIGYGWVRLYSTGVSVQLNFNSRLRR